MITRRCKIQVKPNLKRVAVVGIIGNDQLQQQTHLFDGKTPRIDDPVVIADAQTTTTTDDDDITEQQGECSNNDEDEQIDVDTVPPSPMISAIFSPRNDHVGSVALRTPILHEKQHQRRSVMTGHEQFDPKTMTMQDMISWNPRNQQGLLSPGHEGKRSNLGRKRSPKKQTKSASTSPVKSASNVAATAIAATPVQPPITAPQVKIAADGSLVLDEESLTVRRENNNDRLETVEEGRAPRKITSMSFRKSGKHNKATVWTENETDLFYRILSSTGPDFQLMHDFIPTRSRIDLKNKFRREQRIDPKRIDDTLRMPAKLDESLYDVARQSINSVEEQKRFEKAERDGRKSKVSKVDLNKTWDEATADLEAEAVNEIERLENLPKCGRKRTTKDDVLNFVKQTVCKTTKKTKKEQSFEGFRPTPELCLGADFPSFTLLRTNTRTVTIEANAIVGEPPIVHVPMDSELVVVQPTNDTETARIIIKPPSSSKHGRRGRGRCRDLVVDDDDRQYYLQHERATDGGSDYLHLYGTMDT